MRDGAAKIKGTVLYIQSEGVVPDDHLCARHFPCSRSIVGSGRACGRTILIPDDPRSIRLLMIRRLIIGYVFAIRSERALCREVRLNLAYRWFCGLASRIIPDHSAFSRARNERFRDSDISAAFRACSSGRALRPAS